MSFEIVFFVEFCGGDCYVWNGQNYSIDMKSQTSLIKGQKMGLIGR